MPPVQLPIIRLQRAYLARAVKALGLGSASPAAGGTRVEESVRQWNRFRERACSLVRAMMDLALERDGKGWVLRPDQVAAALDRSLLQDLRGITGRSEKEIGEFISAEIPRLINLRRLSGLLESLGERGTLAVSLAEAVKTDVERPIIAAESGAMRDLLDDLSPAAENPYPVLITGPSGSGKELIARRIHVLSAYARGPFVPVDCAGIPENLLEDELFGHRKGAFTGALRARPGKLELAAGGTLFLDEVAELPPASQAKLLRFLQERVVERLGGGVPVDLDLKVVAATNRDLGQMMDQGGFREDLFYRLATIPLSVPPLKDRPQDIPILIDHYLAQSKKETGLIRGFSKNVREALCAYPFPGNVRELINIINQSVVFSKKYLLDLEDLPAQVRKTLGLAGPVSGQRLQDLAQAGIKVEDRSSVARLLAESGGDRITNADLRRVLNCSDATAKKILNRLADIDLLEPEGTRGGRRYLVKTELKENSE